MDYLANLTLTSPMGIGYAFYDTSDRILDTLTHPDFPAEFRQIATNLTPDAPGA